MARTVVNAVGDTLYYSETSNSWISATGSGPTLSGTAANDAMYGDSSVNVTMAGGAVTTSITSIPRSTAPRRRPDRGSTRSIPG